MGIYDDFLAAKRSVADWWYRLLYWLNAGWIYVLHCFKKTTNKTSQGHIGVARQRIKAIKARKDAPAEKEEENA